LNIYRGLKAAVLNGELAPGEVLNEAELARRWEVSRTPVREAIRQLEQEHLVRWSPRRGATVAGITVAGVRDLYEVREALEGLAAQLAAHRATEEEVGELERLAVAIRAAHDRGDLAEAIKLDDQLHRSLGGQPRPGVAARPHPGPGADGTDDRPQGPGAGRRDRPRARPHHLRAPKA
jgi:DNA-binding GntR family transcriptional regulator